MSDQDKPESKATYVEEGTDIRGSFNSSCPVVVRGSVDGEITAPSLVVSATGSVSGKMRVRELVSDGEISGECDADVMKLSGVVRDNTVLRAKSLEVAAGGPGTKTSVRFGECVLEVGDAPTKEEVLGPLATSSGASVRPKPRSIRPPRPDEEVHRNGHN